MAGVTVDDLHNDWVYVNIGGDTMDVEPHNSQGLISEVSEEMKTCKIGVYIGEVEGCLGGAPNDFIREIQPTEHHVFKHGPGVPCGCRAYMRGKHPRGLFVLGDIGGLTVVNVVLAPHAIPSSIHQDHYAILRVVPAPAPIRHPARINICVEGAILQIDAPKAAIDSTSDMKAEGPVFADSFQWGLFSLTVLSSLNIRSNGSIVVAISRLSSVSPSVDCNACQLSTMQFDNAFKIGLLNSDSNPMENFHVPCPCSEVDHHRLTRLTQDKVML